MFTKISLGRCAATIQHSKSKWPSYIHKGIKHELSAEEVVKIKLTAVLLGVDNPTVY